MSGISTHVLDTAKGLPAHGVRVKLERQSAGAGWFEVGGGSTDNNGRISELLEGAEQLEAGVYRLTFFIADYFHGQESFYPEVCVQFEVRDASRHYHVPLLLSPYGYTTYRGS
ncbi:MAG TPA: hydroxyisourate hydrolase [Bryobacteraceae bacterium]|nr:hydroxyisourate hydrolase [Bryobacteraceae bacterium]